MDSKTASRASQWQDDLHQGWRSGNLQEYAYSRMLALLEKIADSLEDLKASAK